MNRKNHNNPIQLLGHALRIFVSKLTQNPDYYNIKHYSKLRRKLMRNEERWQ